MNILNKKINEIKSDPHVIQSYVAACVVSHDEHDASPWKQ